MTPGIHLVHKPVGPTSFSIVHAAMASRPPRPERRPLRICHGGTLDPFATGLLLLLVEPATRLFDHLHAIPKVYRATIRWGRETDNGDPHGRVVFSGDACGLTSRSIEGALAPFLGWHEQIPPATSAKRVAGERAYVRAHRGETVELPPSRVYLHAARWLEHDLPSHSRLEITVRGGFYVRSLARDLGRALGCGAHLGALHRTAIGPWTDPGPEGHGEVHGRDLLPWAPARMLTDQEVGDLRAGADIPAGALLPPDWRLPEGFPDPIAPIRAFHRQRLAFLLTAQDQRLRVLSALPGGL